jgi:thiazole synthase
MVNTHNIEDVTRGEDLPLGYATATVGSVLRGFETGRLTPVLNINLPLNASEAVERAYKAIDLTGYRTVKLEVVTPDHHLTRNTEVLRATEILVRADLEVWPLITPDLEVFQALQELGCPLIRIMGSPIGSLRGISSEWLPTICQILEENESYVILDGGVGSVNHALKALSMGFQGVLVNSCLFCPGLDPVTELLKFRTSIEHGFVA